jgi:hypothetical protein
MLSSVWRKWDPCMLLVETHTGTAIMENEMEFPQKVLSRVTVWHMDLDPPNDLIYHMSNPSFRHTLKFPSIFKLKHIVLVYSEIAESG